VRACSVVGLPAPATEIEWDPERVRSNVRGVVDLEGLLALRLGVAFSAVAGEPTDPVLRRSPRADYQADGALALARRLRRDPRELAAEIVHRLVAEADLADVCAAVEVAGPGFVNVTVADEALGRVIDVMAADVRLGMPPAAEPRTVVVDYSAPNAAKEMHVGHLRSTVIGDAAVRLHEWLGDRVVRVNHIGDWGTPFGMLIEHLLDLGEAEPAHELAIGDLDAFYKAARAKFNGDDSFAGRARRRVVALQSGDEPTRRLWRLLVAESERYFRAVYDLLDVRLQPGDIAGESVYNDELPSLVDELDAAGLLQDSDGAQCVFPPGFTGRDGQPLPILVRRSGGGFGYGATDLAALRHRLCDVRADRILYVVGAPQHQHLAMVLAVARLAGWLGEDAAVEHVSFGSVLGSDGKMLRSRAGVSVKLADLLDEAVTRAGSVVAAKSPDLSPAEATAVARAVGIGAVKYADLKTDRESDYVFDWGRMLALDGNTAPYLQYAHARIRSILRRADESPGAPVLLGEPAERALALELAGLERAVRGAAEAVRPHQLAGFLFGLATAFSRFYESCPVVLAEDPTVRASRLTLCEVTARSLALGLDLLGIAAPARM
jgi:arginyl-tRNA synthetase